MLKTLALTIPAALAVTLPAALLAQEGGTMLLRGADVVTMQGGWTDPVRADLLVRDGRIAAIGPDLQAEGAEIVDLSGHLVTPGLVDSHWHMWPAIARGHESSARGGFGPTMAPLAAAWTPEASGLAVAYALALAVDSGVTWVDNWAHNTVSPAFADAEIAAMRASGVRGRFSYGYPQAAATDAEMDLADLRATAEDWPDGPLSLGVALRGPDRSSPDVWRSELAAARDLGLPISFHMAGSAGDAALGNAERMAAAGQIGPDMQVVHMTSAPPSDLRLLAEGGASLALTPWTEMQAGYGVPDPGRMVGQGLRLGLGIDNTVLSGQANMFEVMRLTADLGDGHAGRQQAVSDATVFDWATRAGAIAAGAPEGTGVLRAGGPADLIALRADGPETRPSASPAFLLTHAAEPEDVSFVMIDGVVHKRDGRLTRADLDDLSARAAGMMRSIEAAAATE